MLLFFRNVVFLVNLGVALLTLLAFQITYSAEVGHWLAGFLGLLLPVLVLINIFFVVWWALGRSWFMLLSVAVLSMGYNLLPRTYRWARTEPTKVVDKRPFTVLSYNVMYLDVSGHLDGKRRNSKKIVGVLDTLRADIKCFQELYNSEKTPALQSLNKLTRRTPFYTYMHSSPSNNEGIGDIGLAIFSKYPIISKKEVYWKVNNNGILAADIVVKTDTIRVFNVQLHSMGIRVGKVLESRRNQEQVKQETRNILSKLKNGFQTRATQVRELEKMIKNSPYPVILCGDFNEVPYGYAYGRIRKQLANAFEIGGRGFGFTYNKMPAFIRIDNQFYSAESVNLLDFITLSDIPYSDHYPILGRYQVSQ